MPMSEQSAGPRATPIDAGEAALSLQHIAETERRTREALYYAGGSLILILWGVSWAAGYAITYVSPRHANLAWGIINGLAIAVMIALGYLRSRRRPARWDWRATHAFIIVSAFGLFTEWLLGNSQWREIGLFWPVLAMAGYMVAGLWLGRFYLLCGASVILLSLMGYFWSGQWFPLWMAVIGGGSLILGGLWLRRVGVGA